MKSTKLLGLLWTCSFLMACSQEQGNNSRVDYQLSSLSTPVESTEITSYDFGSALVKGQSVASKQFTIIKSASQTEAADSTVSLESLDGAFVLTSSSCNRELKKATDKCYPKITFTKKDFVGSYSGSLKVGPVGSELIIALSATVIDPTPVAQANLKAYLGSTLLDGAVSFGELTANKSSVQTITIKNEGSVAVNLTSSLAESVNFVQNSNSCAGVSLGANKACYIKVTFKANSQAPEADEARQVNLSVNALTLSLEGVLKGSPSVQLLANVQVLEGTTERSLESPVVFGSVAQGSSTPKTLTLKNVGTGASAALNLALTGSSRLVLSNVNCGTNLAAGASCFIKVVLQAGSGQTTDEAVAGTLTVLDKSAAISGNIIGVPAKVSDVRIQDGNLEISSFDFGSSLTGNSNLNKIFTIKNIGEASTSGAVSVGVTGSGYSITSNTCSVILGAGKTCSIRVNLATGAAQVSNTTLSGTLSVSDKSLNLTAIVLGEAPKTPDVKVLSGTIEVNSFDMGSVELGNTAYKIFYVKNEGDGKAPTPVVSLVGAGFSLASNTCVAGGLNAGSSCSVRVNFVPASAGAVDETKTATLSVDSKTVALSVVVKADVPKAADLRYFSGTLEVSSHDFGDVPSNSSVNRIFTVKNVGDAPSAVPSVEITGPGLSLMSNTCIASLGINKTCSIRVAFSASAPASDTLRQGTVSILGKVLSIAATEKAPLLASVKYYESSVEVMTLDFGVANNTVKTIIKNINVVNEGGGPVSGGSVSLTPATGSGFVISQNACGASLNPGSSCLIRLVLSSVDQANGQKSAVLSYAGSSLNLAGEVNVAACSSSQHEEGGVCVANTRSCSPMPANTVFGSQQWISGAWGSCQATVCSSTYAVLSGVCTKTYQLSVTNPQGASLVPSKLPPYFANEVITISANVNQDYELTAWTGDCASSGTSLTCSLTMNANKTASAVVVAVSACSENEHDEGGVCVANVRACAVTPPNAVTATETWNGSWGSCVITCDGANGFSPKGSGPTYGCWNNVALAITGGSTAVESSGSRNFSASGGRPPYVYSVSSTIGSSIGSSSGVYVAGSPSSETGEQITVTDSLGQQDSIAVTVSAPAVNMRTLTVNKNRPEGRIDIYSVSSGWSYDVCSGQTSCQRSFPQGDSLHIQGDYYYSNGLFFVGFSDCLNTIVAGDNTCPFGYLNSNSTITAVFSGPDLTSPSSPYYSSATSSLGMFQDSVTALPFSFVRQGQSYSYQPVNSAYDPYFVKPTFYSASPDVRNNTEFNISGDSSLTWSAALNYLGSAINAIRLLPTTIGNYVLNLTGLYNSQSYSEDYKVKVFDSNEFGYGGIVNLYKLRQVTYSAQTSNYPYDNQFIALYDDGRFYLRYLESPDLVISKFTATGERDHNFNTSSTYYLSKAIAERTQYFSGFVGSLYPNHYSRGKVVGDVLHVITSFSLNDLNAGEIVLYKVNADGTNTFGDTLNTMPSQNFITKGKMSGLGEAGKNLYAFHSKARATDFLVLANLSGASNTLSSKLAAINYSTGTVERDNSPMISESRGSVYSTVSSGEKQVFFTEASVDYAPRAMLAKGNSSKFYLMAAIPKTVVVSGLTQNYHEVRIMKFDESGNFDSSYASPFVDSNNLFGSYVLNNALQDNKRGHYVDGENLFFLRHNQPILGSEGNYTLGTATFELAKLTPTGQLDTNFNFPIDNIEYQCDSYPTVFHADGSYIYYGFRQSIGTPELGYHCSVFTVRRANKLTGAIDPVYGHATAIYNYTANGQFSMNSESNQKFFGSVTQIEVQDNKAYILFDNMVAKLNITTGNLDVADPQSHIMCSGGVEGSWNAQTLSCECENGGVVFKGVCETAQKAACESGYAENGRPTWDDGTASCMCPDIEIIVGTMNNQYPTYFNYETNQCERPEVECTGGYWNNNRCECPSGYDVNESAYGCRPTYAYKNCMEDGGTWDPWGWMGYQCQCPMGYQGDGNDGCQINQEYQECTSDSNAYWSDIGGGSGSCYCYDSNHQWQWSNDLGRMACFNQQEVDCTSGGGTWEGGWCNYGCGNYNDQSSCDSVGGGGRCWWEMQYSDCSNLGNDMDCMNYGCSWDFEMMYCSGGSYQDPNNGMCNSN